MRGLLLTLVFAAAMALSALALGIAATPAEAHRGGCHRWHSCPSDHATYRWRGLLCVKPTSDARNSSFRQRVVSAGLPYFCKR
jgi:hypothetical protein